MEEIKSKSVDLGKLQQCAHELMEKVSGGVSSHFVLLCTLNLAQFQTCFNLSHANLKRRKPSWCRSG